MIPPPNFGQTYQQMDNRNNEQTDQLTNKKQQFVYVRKGQSQEEAPTLIVNEYLDKRIMSVLVHPQSILGPKKSFYLMVVGFVFSQTVSGPVKVVIYSVVLSYVNVIT